MTPQLPGESLAAWVLRMAGSYAARHPEALVRLDRIAEIDRQIRAKANCAYVRQLVSKAGINDLVVLLPQETREERL